MPPSDSDKDDRMLPSQDLDERSLAAIMTPHRVILFYIFHAFLSSYHSSHAFMFAFYCL